MIFSQIIIINDWYNILHIYIDRITYNKPIVLSTILN